MSNASMIQKHSLNLSPRYVPDWGPWEIAREFICNAIDAAEDKMSIEGDGADRLIIRTPTAPEFAHLFIIGEGTKAIGGATIGQFGEGAKMAALAVTRLSGASLSIRLPGYCVTFGFEAVLSTDVLHAYVEEDPESNAGCTVDITYPGIGRVATGRILDDRSARPMGGAGGQSCQIYVKGVWIANMPEESIWDWNFSYLPMNRDRGMVDRVQTVDAMGNWLVTHGTIDHAKSLLSKQKCLETVGLGAVYWRASTNRFTSVMTSAFREMYGEVAVLKDDKPSINEAAAHAGYIPISVKSELSRYLDVKTAAEVIPHDHEYVAVDPAPFAEQIAWLRQLDPIIDAPNVSVSVFAQADCKSMGFANRSDRRMWLAKDLFGPGRELQLVRTYLHEMGHFIGNAKDATREFEDALDCIAGRLAIILLTQSHLVEA